ncbi:MAG: DUF6464 family protein [Nostoc sp.]|uniref:DUF6464 family protein n=1 Tax=Nostoc sp. TaxID=1180 RepID=UPI002FFB6B67
MKKFDWFTALASLAIAENTICFIIQGGWMSVLGVIIFGGIWLWVAYWDWKRYQTIKSDQEEAILNFLSSDEMQSEDNSSPSGIDFEAIASGYSTLLSRDEEASVDELIELRFIGDLGCKNNARSPYLRCAIKPSGPCEKCQFYAKI